MLQRASNPVVQPSADRAIYLCLCWLQFVDAGCCVQGAGQVFFTEFLGNRMVNSDGIVLRNDARSNYSGVGAGSACTVAGRGGYGGNTSWMRWSAVRRNRIGGISAASFVANSSAPACGSIALQDSYAGGEDVGLVAATDIVAEHNVVACPTPGRPSGGHGVELEGCAHCVVR